MKSVWTSRMCWNSGWLAGAGVYLALMLLVVCAASADEPEGIEVSVPKSESSPTPTQASCEHGNPAAIVGPDVSWETQRRIPSFSAFVNGTGYWGPSRNPDAD